jgi:hypothetical protein
MQLSFVILKLNLKGARICMDNKGESVLLEQEPFHKLYSETRQLSFMNILEKKLVEIAYAVQGDEVYGEDDLMEDLFGLVDSIIEEKSTLLGDIFRKLSEEKQNRPNSAFLAGRS